MAGRTGIPSLMKVAREMCRLITKFTPVIIRIYPTNTTLHAALAAANTACAALHAAAAEVREYGD